VPIFLRCVSVLLSVGAVVAAIPALAAESPAPWRPWYRWRQPEPGHSAIAFPEGDLFAAPQADLKQPRFHTTWQRYHGGYAMFDMASVGIGSSLGLVRWPGAREGDGWQLGISGAVFAIFNLEGRSSDLLNADYVIGFPLSWRRGNFSARARLFHQSSHLGDEFLLEPQPGPHVERINLSYVALELLGSWETHGLRFYGGGARLVQTYTNLGRTWLQAGADYHGGPAWWRSWLFVAAVDIEAWSETDWSRDVSAQAGIMVRSRDGAARTVQFLLQYYSGHSPYGQFYTDDVEFWGAGITYNY